MRNNNSFNSILWLLVVLALGAAACGSDPTAIATTSPETASTDTDPATEPDGDDDDDDDVILQMEDIGMPVSEQNLQEARHVFDEGKLRWESFDPFAHVMTVGLDSVVELRLEFDAEGALVAEELPLGDPENSMAELLPRSVDDVFAELDALITSFETGERSAPPEGECGAHFNARFNNDWGVPEYYDTLGPCDDGVGISVSIARVDGAN